MRLTVTDTWSITIDNHNNHCPEKWVVKPGGEKTPRGELSKPFEGWVHQGKFYPNVGQALRYIAGNGDYSEARDAIEYVDLFEARMIELVASVRASE